MEKQRNFIATKLKLIIALTELSRAVNPQYFYEINWKNFLNQNF
tara:strand:+ start:280 stop:411 length:132 start_codon:yes stop_codon:yes gene_type:complete